jgi:hypothetical protein
MISNLIIRLAHDRAAENWCRAAHASVRLKACNEVRRDNADEFQMT